MRDIIRVQQNGLHELEGRVEGVVQKAFRVLDVKKMWMLKPSSKAGRQMHMILHF